MIEFDKVEQLPLKIILSVLLALQLAVYALGYHLTL